MQDGASYAGVLWEADRAVVVLRSAEALAVGPDRTPVPVDGELVLLMASISHLQRP